MNADRAKQLKQEIADYRSTLSDAELQLFRNLRAQRSKLQREIEEQEHSYELRPTELLSFDLNGFGLMWGFGDLTASEVKRVTKLRAAADAAVHKRSKPRPQLGQGDARFAALRKQVWELECARAEYLDVWCSPSALRHLADAIEQAIVKYKAETEAEIERRRKAEQRMRAHERVRDPLDVLNLPRGATAAQIQERYRTLLKRLHPDVNAGSEAAVGLLRQVTDAMEQLRAAGQA